MTEFDQALKERAARESCPVPMEFDRRVNTILAELPEERRGVRRGGPVRVLLSAAALCVLCVVSALALSPGLREQLAAALGGFAPYAQTVEGSVCVENGVEIRVISAVADGSMVKVYAEARDLEGDRLTSEILEAELKGQMTVWGVVDRYDKDFDDEGVIISYASGASCVGFDEATKTALLEFCTWGTFPDDAQGMELIVFDLFPEGIIAGEEISGERWRIPLTIETLDRRSFNLSGTLEDIEVNQLELSAMGVSLITGGTGYPPSSITVYLEDGSSVQVNKTKGSGGTLESCVSYWEFADPVEIEHVVAVAFGQWYIPLNTDGTVGESYWITE